MSQHTFNIRMSMSGHPILQEGGMEGWKNGSMCFHPSILP